MEPNEIVKSKHMCFIHLIYKLENLGKILSNMNCANKMLKLMCRVWEAQVTLIKESRDLKTLDIIIMFEKLTKHEHRLKRL